MVDIQILEKIVKDTTNDYFDIFKVNPFNVRIIITNNMSASYCEARPDLGYQEGADIYNGIMVQPKHLGERFTILINKKKFEENTCKGHPETLGTIVHELTHISDYTKYADLVGEDNFDTIADPASHPMFMLWTEIHARANGYYYMRWHQLRNKFGSPKYAKMVLEQELPFQNNYMISEYNHADSWYQKAYLVAQYLGRLYTIRNVYKKTISYVMLLSVTPLSKNKWMKEWFDFFCSHDTLEKAFPSFNEMNTILPNRFPSI